MLPQTQQQQAQVALHLHAVQVHRNFQVRHGVIPKEHTVRPLHIQAFNRKNIRGALQFLAQEKQGAGSFSSWVHHCTTGASNCNS